MCCNQEEHGSPFLSPSKFLILVIAITIRRKYCLKGYFVDSFAFNRFYYLNEKESVLQCSFNVMNECYKEIILCTTNTFDLN